ncbi:molybdopterin-dependent oxidoreductase [Nocardia noduli]|uniref:molybdopterin-dependent oxidoreductase n=1 Tax=Nocardia noduli TaxID=2815722 RepID=UPI001C244B0A|nr:molybdopterin-dependent oxidoreductase [Nocardia noduli]
MSSGDIDSSPEGSDFRRVREWSRISRARGPEVASRVGIALGVAILICFCTGLISHGIQHPPDWFRWPAHPVWLYRFTQGLHVVSGVAAIPLVVVKLWAVYPRLFQRPLFGSPLRALERGSIALLVGAVLFELSTGLLNIAQWYPWKFFFPTAHYAMAFIVAGALAVHLAVKLPVIRAALSRPLDSEAGAVPGTAVGPRRGVEAGRPVEASGGSPGTSEPSDTDIAGGQRSSRRTVLAAAGVSAGLAAVAVAGQSVPLLRRLSFAAPRSGQGPQGLPVNRSATAAGVRDSARDPAYRLRVVVGERSREFSRDELSALPQTTATLPIACVEGWSASADWSGVRLRDLLEAVGPYPGGAVGFASLETGGIYRTSLLPQPHVVASDTLIALTLNGETLDLDHGYPCRLIAPNRPGVLQTKWLSSIEVRA